MKNRLTSRLTLALAACAALLLVLAAPSAVGADAAAEGTLTEASFASATLNEAISYNVYLPAGYEGSTERYPVLYLLHGRGDSKSAWTQMKGALDALIASGEIQPTIAIMPDAPWSSRASYYVDSGYTGADPGRNVETAFTQDLIAHVDGTYRTVANRTGRGVAGYSMGGYGALRYSLAHPDLFGASIVLSPAVYVPIPPSDSSTREFGAFGLGKSLFVDSVYKKLNYPALFPSFTATGLPLPMFIAVGDDEFKNPDPKDAIHDLDFEAHVLFNQAVRVPNLTAELRVVDGGHDWDVWGPTFVEGAKYIFQFLNQAPVAPVKATITGTAQEERAGGVATDAAGNVYQALAAGGSVAGQPYAGDKDLVLVKDSPTGTRLWTRELGTARLERAYGVAIDPAGDVVVTGYTTGDFDGAHGGNTTDDVFVAKFDSNGTLTWLRQFGVAAVADRGYALATDATGNVYVTGYTRGNLAATNQGDKDVYIAKFDPNGVQSWLQQFGSTGEDKAWGVAATADGIRLGGMTSGALGTTAGALDGWVARYDPAGNRAWLQQFGTAANEEVWGLTADAAGNTYVAAYSAGDFDGPLAGDKDLVAARFDAAGTLTWKDQLGTDLNDKSAAVGLDAAGNLYVAGFSDGDLESPLGKFDAVLVKYAPDTTREWVRQFGTTEDDGADVFAEANLYLATHGGSIYVSGLTLGDVDGQAQLGLGDVFLARFDAAGTNG
ncbi:MAG TPA: alpha/beta hydrolase-fold protein [Gaiellaceae bacterium]|nr:alpha/beta hydrolase-fold protein [Gaiellaceae bacterium]